MGAWYKKLQRCLARSHLLHAFFGQLSRKGMEPGQECFTALHAKPLHHRLVSILVSLQHWCGLLQSAAFHRLLRPFVFSPGVPINSSISKLAQAGSRT